VPGTENTDMRTVDGKSEAPIVFCSIGKIN
jgi:hypothetical protein